jgi:hypothetical protein
VTALPPNVSAQPRAARDTAGFCFTFRGAQRVRPHAVRDTPVLLAGYQKRLIAQGVELRWPG